MWDHSISVTTTYKDDNPNVPLRIATQFLIYEIVCGLRDPETFALNSANESGTAGNIFYNAGAASVSYFAPNYNTLVSCVQAALKIPSFTSSSSSSAPTITLTGDRNQCLRLQWSSVRVQLHEWQWRRVPQIRQHALYLPDWHHLRVYCLQSDEDDSFC